MAIFIEHYYEKESVFRRFSEVFQSSFPKFSQVFRSFTKSFDTSKIFIIVIIFPDTGNEHGIE